MCQTRTISYICSHFCTFRLSKCQTHYLAPSSSSKNKKSPREERKPSCSGNAAITVYSQQECGPCSKERATKTLDDKVAALVFMTSCSEEDYGRDGTEDEGEADKCRDTELVRLQEERDRRLFVLDMEFPDWRYKKNTMQPEKGFTVSSSCPPELSSEPSLVSTPSQRPQQRPPSKLRTEVLPEEIILPFIPDETSYSPDADCGWADPSSGEWPSLADEIAEDEAAREAASITVSWSPWAGQKSAEEETLYQSWSPDKAVKETKSKTGIKETAVTTKDDADFRIEDRTNQSSSCDSNPQKGGVDRIDEKVEQNPEKNWDEKSFGVLDNLLAVH